jgi:hypothetical protein
MIAQWTYSARARLAGETPPTSAGRGREDGVFERPPAKAPELRQAVLSNGGCPGFVAPRVALESSRSCQPGVVGDGDAVSRAPTSRR